MTDEEKLNEAIKQDGIETQSGILEELKRRFPQYAEQATNEQEIERMAKIIYDNYLDSRSCARELQAQGIGDKKQAVKEAFEKLVLELYLNNMNKQEMYIDNEWISVDNYVEKIANKVLIKLYGAEE